MKSGKKKNILLRFVVALLTIFIAAICSNQPIKAEKFIVYYNYNNIPASLRDSYNDNPSMFRFSGSSIYFYNGDSSGNDGELLLVVPEGIANSYYSSEYLYFPDLGNNRRLTKTGTGTLNLNNIYSDGNIQRGIIVRGGKLTTSSGFNMSSKFDAVTGSGAEWAFDSDLYVTGRFEITKGGKATVDDNLYIGQDSSNNPARGYVIVSGKGSSGASSELKASQFFVGYTDSGILDILDGAIATAVGTSSSFIAVGNNSRGIVNVVGGGSRFELGASTLGIGTGANSNHGILNIINGGNVATTGNISVGSGTGTGTINVSGISDTTAIRSKGVIDLYGSTLGVVGNAIVEAGSISATNSSIFIASRNGRKGNLQASKLSISNSTVNNIGGSMIVNNVELLNSAGTYGRLNLFNGGILRANSLSIATNSNQTGVFNVSGGSTLDVINQNADTELQIGAESPANSTEIVNISDGASLSTSASGNVVTSTNNLDGSVTTTTAPAVNTINITPSGTVNVAGQGSSLTGNNANLNVTGKLNVASGAKVQTGLLDIEAFNGSKHGQVYVDGAGSNLTANTGINVVGITGSTSAGTRLGVGDGGSITTGGDLIISSDGIVNIRGTLNLAGNCEIVVGNDQDNGELNLIGGIGTPNNTNAHNISVTGASKLNYFGSVFNLYSGNIGIDSDSSVVFNTTGSGTTNVGAITAAGYLRLSGSGVAFNGMTVDGTLVTTSDMTTNNQAVAINGILAGTSTITNALVNTSENPLPAPADRNGFTFGAVSMFSAGANPGSIGTMTLNGDVTLSSGMTFKVDVGKNNNTIIGDKLVITRSTTLGTYDKPEVLLASDAITPATINVDLSSLVTFTGTQNLDILSFTGSNGRIVTEFTDFTDSPDPASVTSILSTDLNLDIELNGEDWTAGGRVTGDISGKIGTGNSSLTLEFMNVAFTNDVSTWTGTGAATDWNLTVTNWEQVPSTPIAFLDGDAVKFSSVYGIIDTTMSPLALLTPQTITLGGTGKTVAEMTVSGPDTNVIFIGNILADGSKTTLTTNKSGKLILDASLSAGSVSSVGATPIPNKVQFNGSNEFVGGIDLKGGIIILGNDKAFGTYVQSTTRGNVNVDLSGALINSSLMSSILNWGDVGVRDDYFGVIVTPEARTLTNRFDDSGVTSLSNFGTLFFVHNGKLVFENVRGGDGVFNFTKGTNLTFGSPLRVGTTTTSTVEIDEVIPILSSGGLVFRNNTSTVDGGAIEVTGNGTLTFDPHPTLEVYNNTATGKGGGIITDDDLDLSYIYNAVVFENNQAGGDGGALYVDGNLSLNLNNFIVSPDREVIFAGNVSGNNGGAINAGSIDLAGSVLFNGNSAKNGGAIYTSGFNLTSGNIVFNGNRATASGGAIYGTTSLNISLSNGSSVIFNGNEAGSGGGAIYAVSNVTITLPTALDYLLTSFVGNKTNDDGGAIKAGDTVTLSSNNMFASNSATGNGGAISSASLVVGSSSSFINNRANRGGAFYGNYLNVNGNTSFIDNFATEFGGAAYITNNGIVTLNTDAGDIAFSNNNIDDNNTPKANSLYLESNVAVALSGGHNFYFDDPILSGDDGGNSLTKNGTGFVQFVGENILNPQTKDSTVRTLNINAGTFRLAEVNSSMSNLNPTSFTTNDEIKFANGTTLAGQGILRAGKFDSNNIFDRSKISFGDNVTFDLDSDQFEPPAGIGFANAVSGRNEVIYSRIIGNYELDANVEFGNNITYKVDLSEEKFAPNSIIKTMPEFVVDDDDKSIIDGIISNGSNPNYEIKKSDDILITGDISTGITAPSDRIKVELNNWVDGTFELMRAEKGELLKRDWFIADDELKAAGMAIGTRQTANLIIDTVVVDGGTDYNRLLLVTATPFNNKDLIWTGLNPVDQWNTTKDNWRDLFTTMKETFNPNDYVIFNGKGDGRNNVDIENNVQVAGMRIIGGSNTFVSPGIAKVDAKGNTYYEGGNGRITGTSKITSNGQTVTGRLDITTTQETVISIPTSFDKGTHIYDNGAILVGHHEALGKLTNDAYDGDESGIVYIQSNNSSSARNQTLKIKGFGHHEITNGQKIFERDLVSQNWFYVASSSELTLETELGTTWTIKGNDGVIASDKAYYNSYNSCNAGAVYAGNYSDLTINGGMSFIDNIAPYYSYSGNGYGYGAIHLAGGNLLNIDSTNGNIKFSGNYYNDGSVDKYLAISTAGNVAINITGSSNGSVFFDDPIQVRDPYYYTLSTVPTDAYSILESGNPIGLFIDFRTPDGSNTEGFVQFKGDNIINGNITINGGTLRLVDETDDAKNAAGVKSSIDIGSEDFTLVKGAQLAGNGIIKFSKQSQIKLSGTISPDSFIYEPKIKELFGYQIQANRNNDESAIGTIQFTNSSITENYLPELQRKAIEIAFYGVTLAVNLEQTKDSEGKVLGHRSDKIVVDGHVSFGNEINTIKIAEGDWKGPEKYVLIEADSIDAVNNQWVVRYDGATIAYYAVNGLESEYLKDGYKVMDDSRVVLAVLDNDDKTNDLGDPNYNKMMILQLRSGEWNGDVLNWTGAGDWSDSEITDKNLVVLNDNTDQGNDHVVITAVTDDVTMSGLEVSGKIFELRLPSRNSEGHLIINPNPKFDGYVANGLVYVNDGGTLLAKVPIKSAYGTLLEGGTLIYGTQDAFGSYFERYLDETHSQGRITVRGTDNTIKAETSVNAKNRIVMEPNSTLELAAAQGEVLRLTDVITSANGAAISLTDGAELKINGNVFITNNTSQLIGNASQFSSQQTNTNNGITAGAGIGGGIYAENSIINFDTTDGSILISGNKDSNGANGMLLVSKNTTEITNIIIPPPINSTPSSNNYAAIVNGGGNVVTFTGNSRHGIVFDDPILVDTSAVIYNPHLQIGPVALPNPASVSNNNFFYLDFENPQAFVQLTSAVLGKGSIMEISGGSLHLAGKIDEDNITLVLGIKEAVEIPNEGVLDQFWADGYVWVENGGGVTGNGSIRTLYHVYENAYLSPDSEKFTATSSIIDSKNLVGTIVLDAESYGTDNFFGTNGLLRMYGPVILINTTLNIDLKKDNISDKVILSNNGGYDYYDENGGYTNSNDPNLPFDQRDPTKFTRGNGTLENNIINIGSWHTGQFTVLESVDVASQIGSDAFPPDMLERFSLELGGDQNGSRQKADLLFGSGSNGGTVDNYTTLQVLIEMKDEDRRRIVWTKDADGYLNTSSNGNWLDDDGKAESFNHSDYIVFDATGKQGTVILGKPIIDTTTKEITDIKYGARTFSSLLIGGGNYTFEGGDFFGIAANFNDGGQVVNLYGDVEIGAGNITFKNNLYTEGKIEILNNALVTLLGHKAFHAEQEINVAKTATVVIEPTTDMIKANEINFAGEIKLINETPLASTTNEKRIENVMSINESGTPFSIETQETLKSKIEKSGGFWSRYGEFKNAATSMDIVYKTLTADEYAKLHNFNTNNTALAEYFAQAFNHWSLSEFEQHLMKLNDEQLLTLFSNLSNTVIHSEAKYMALTSPYHTISNHLFSLQDVDNYRYNYSLLRGAPKNPNTTRDFWFSTDRYDLEMTSDGNAQNLETFRSGFNIGIDKRFNNALLAGLILSTGDAKLTQRQNGNKIDMDDFVFGLYMQYQFLNELQLNSYIGLGLQQFKSKRQSLLGFDQNTSTPIYGFTKSEYDGDSAFWNIELIRPIHWRSGIAFMPGVAVDVRYAHTDSFAVNDYLQTKISGSKIDQIFFRAGFNSLWKINDRFRLETQSWYSRQIGGNDSLSMSMSIPEAGIIKPAHLKGIKAGRNLASLGIGSRYYMTDKKQSQLIVDYIFERGDRSKTHVVNLGFNYNF
ncbi:MAG: hypothetical protein LBJ00_06080 [Planctomycetaceae bacterium]|nr:hypothetical protein [Planctomycetaceae bacterium]